MAEATRKSVITAAPHAGQTASPNASQSAPKTQPALRFERFFSKPTVSPYDEVQWERRTALITDASGKTIFEQKDVEVPIDWSMTATNIVASKYLHGQLGTPQRETGVRAAHRPRRRDRPRLGPGRRILRHARRRRHLSRRARRTCS